MDEYQIVDVPGVGEVEFPATMKDEEIVAAVSKMSRGQAQEPAQAGAESDVSAEGDSPLGDGLIAPPGVLTGLGGVSALAAKSAPAVVGRTGKMLEKANRAMKVGMGAAGASTGAVLGGSVAGTAGAFGGSSVGGALGYEAAKKMIPSVQKLGETLKLGAEKAKAPAILDKKGNVLFPAGSPHSPIFPVKGANYKTVAKIAGGLGKLGKVAGPAGIGLTILDLAQMLMSGEMGKNLRARATGFANHDPRAAMGEMPVDDDEAKIQELMSRMAPVRSH